MIGKIVVAACLAMLPALSAATAQESVFHMDEDVFAAGGDLIVTGRAGGDLIAAGGSVDIAAGDALDVIAAGGQLFVEGPVGEDAILAGGSVTISGSVAEDLIATGGQVRVSRGARIGDDVLIAGGSVRLDGDVGGNAVLAGGRLAVGGTIDGDLKAAGGRLEILSGARIAGSVSFRGGEAPVISPGAVIGGEVEYVAEERFGRYSDGHRGIGWGGGVWLALTMIVTGIVVILLLPGIANGGADRLRERPLASALIGLALLAGIPVLAMLLMATVIGIPLGVIVMALYPASLFVGFVVAAFALSEWALHRRVTTPRLLQRFGAFALVVAALFLAFAIPWVGGWLALITLLFGLGALGQVLFAARGDRSMAL